MSSELVPFGKHKGQPVEIMLADPGYREWVLAQPWVKDRYPTFHQTIINFGGEPADTPEHNQMQAAFLDDTFCLALARILLHPSVFNGKDAINKLHRSVQAEWYALTMSHLTATPIHPHIWRRDFEVDGWDVVFHVQGTGVYLELESMPPCKCVCDHERDCPGVAPCRGGEGDDYKCQHRHTSRTAELPPLEWAREASGRDIEMYCREADWSSSSHCNKSCPWGKHGFARWLLTNDGETRVYEPHEQVIRVECKPDLGDDFPAVLRQVKQRPPAGVGEHHCVIVRRSAFESVTGEQVTQMFAALRVTLVSEHLLEETPE